MAKDEQKVASNSSKKTSKPTRSKGKSKEPRRAPFVDATAIGRKLTEDEARNFLGLLGAHGLNQEQFCRKLVDVCREPLTQDKLDNAKRQIQYVLSSQRKWNAPLADECAKTLGISINQFDEKLRQDMNLVPVVAQAVAQALSAVGFSPNRLAQAKTAILKSMIERYSECEIVNARGTFWRQVGEQAKAGDIADIQEALAASGMPPGLPLKDGHLVDLARSFHENPDNLTQAQARIWCLACSIYPWGKMEESPIGRFGTEFDVARRTLANFWKDNVKKAEIEEVEIVPEIGKQFESATHQTYLLSWLELPLVLRTGDRGQGKAGLFKLARWFQDRSVSG